MANRRSAQLNVRVEKRTVYNMCIAAQVIVQLSQLFIQIGIECIICSQMEYLSTRKRAWCLLPSEILMNLLRNIANMTVVKDEAR